MQDPQSSRAIIRYRGKGGQFITRHCTDLNSNERWVSFVGEVEVLDPTQPLRVKAIPRLFYVPLEWVAEIEVLP